jgi:hypothetical protein
VTKILKRDFKKASKPHKIAVFKSRNFVGGDVRDRTAVLKQIISASTCLAELNNFTLQQLNSPGNHKAKIWNFSLSFNQLPKDNLSSVNQHLST